jgi:hypothetical protein
VTRVFTTEFLSFLCLNVAYKLQFSSTIYCLFFYVYFEIHRLLQSGAITDTGIFTFKLPRPKYNA